MNPGTKITYTLTLVILSASTYCLFLLGSVSNDPVFRSEICFAVAVVLLIAIPVYSIRIAKKFYLHSDSLSSSLTLIFGRMLPCIFMGVVLGMQVSSIAIIYYLKVNFWFVYTAEYATLLVVLTVMGLLLPHLAHLYRADDDFVVSTLFHNHTIRRKDISTIKKCLLSLYCLHYLYDSTERKAYFILPIHLIGKLPNDASLKDLEIGNQVSYRFSKLTAWFKSTLFGLLF